MLYPAADLQRYCILCGVERQKRDYHNIHKDDCKWYETLTSSQGILSMGFLSRYRRYITDLVPGKTVYGVFRVGIDGILPTTSQGNLSTFEPRREKTCLRAFRSGPTQSCTATEDGQGLVITGLGSRGIVLSMERKQRRS